MTVMRNVEQYPNSEPIANKKVLFKIWSAPAYNVPGGNSIEAVGEVSTDETGYWEAEFTPTDDLEPSGQVYIAEIVFRGGSIRHLFVVPTVTPELGVEPYWIGDHRAEEPGALPSTPLVEHIEDPTASHAASSVSVLPVGGLVATQAQEAFAELDSQLAAEALTRGNADVGLGNRIGVIEALGPLATDAELATESAARQGADNALDGRLDSIEALGPLATDAELAAEAAARAAAIADEATTRANADSGLDGRLDSIEALGPLATDAELAAETAARIADVNDEEAARVAADDAETAARIAADDAEEAARIAADDAETTARIADVNDEEAARIAADDAEEAARIAADDAETAARIADVNAEEAARIAADDAIAADLVVMGGLKVNKAGDTMTGALTVPSLIAIAATASSVPLVTKGAASQTGDLFQAQNSAGTALTSIAADGTISVKPNQVNAVGVSFYSADYAIGIDSNALVLSHGAGGSLKVKSGGVVGGTNRMEFDGSGNVGFNGVPVSSLTTRSTTAANPVLVAIGAASQVGDLQQWRNSAGTVLSYVTASGRLVVPDAIISIIYTTAFERSDALSAIQLLTTGVYIPSRAAGNVGLLVRGAASQTGNLQEWQNSGGGVLARISSGGIGVFPQGLLSPTLGADTAATILVQTGGLTGQSTLSVRAASGQTGDLQQWQDSAGTVLTRLSANGSLSINNSSTTALSITRVTDGYVVLDANTSTLLARATYSFLAGGTVLGSSLLNVNNAAGLVSIVSAGSGYVPFIVTGAAGQTSDLQRWQNSSGTVLSRITSAGNFHFGEGNNAGYAIDLGPIASGDSVVSARIHTIYAKSISNPFDVLSLSALQTLTFGNGGSITQNLPESFSIQIKAGNNASAATHIEAGTAAAVALRVRAVASQTGDLQQWQDSAGTIGSKIGSVGQFSSTMVFTSGALTGFGGAPQAWFTVPAANLIPIAIRGAAAQTADLQQWQNSAGTVLSRITASGQLGIGTAPTEAPFEILAGGNIPAIIRSNSTYNTEFQIRNGLGADLRTWTWMVAGTAGPIPHGSMTLYDALYGGHRLFIGGGAQNGKVGVNTGATTPSGQFQVNVAAASEVGSIVRGAAAQTADLQQWQNSAGTVLGSVSSSGVHRVGINQVSSTEVYIGNDTANAVALEVRGYFTGSAATSQTSRGNMGAIAVVNYNNGRAQASLGGDVGLYAEPRHAGAVAAIVRGFTTQTADLQQWQDSAGTVLTRIKADGTLDASFAGPAFNGNIVVNNTTASGYGAIFRGAGLGAQFVTGSISGTAAQFRWGSAGQTASIISCVDNTGAPLVDVLAAGDLEFFSSIRGPILRSPTGIRYRITVSDAGALSTVAA